MFCNTLFSPSEMKFMDNTTAYTFLNNALTEVKEEIKRKYFMLR